jgi:hypothetical protein
MAILVDQEWGAMDQHHVRNTFSGAAAWISENVRPHALHRGRRSAPKMPFAPKRAFSTLIQSFNSAAEPFESPT